MLSSIWTSILESGTTDKTDKNGSRLIGNANLQKRVSTYSDWNAADITCLFLLLRKMRRHYAGVEGGVSARYRTLQINFFVSS